MGLHVRAAFLLLCFVACGVDAADICPAPPKYSQTKPADLTPDDHRIYIDSDAGTADDSGATVSGRVKVRQDERSVAADSLHYDRDLDKITVVGNVDFLDPKLRVRSASGTYETAGSASFDQANFQLMDRNGRGVGTRHQFGHRRQG